MFELGLGEVDDRQIWDFARERGFMIVSKDSDFHQLSVWRGPPPKVVWVRLGNCSVDAVESALRSRARELEDFSDGPSAFLVIGSVP